MKLFCVTLTGADDHTDPQDLVDLSARFPFVEWGILLSKSRAGTPRYPSAEWLEDLADLQGANDPGRFSERPPLRLAAHLCGGTMRAFLRGITFAHHDEGAWLAPHGLAEITFNGMFDRIQVNVNATRENLTADDLTAMIDGWVESFDGNLITQHNSANAHVWEILQSRELATIGPAWRPHQLLHDASGGRGLSPDCWPRPIAGMLNGYAGGIGPENVTETLEALAPVIGDGFTWIDMEGRLRGEDDRFDLERVTRVLEKVAHTGSVRGWI